MDGLLQENLDVLQEVTNQFKSVQISKLEEIICESRKVVVRISVLIMSK